LFTGVFTLGVFLAALGGAVQIPRDAVHNAMDLQIIVEAFVVVVIGGFGNVLGAFLASFIIAELNAFGILLFPKISMILMFLVMAVVLVIRPYGLLGKAEAHPRTALGSVIRPWAPLSKLGKNWVLALGLALVFLPMFAGDFLLNVSTEILIFALFAASLHLMMGVGGMVSFGHAAYFGLGAYGTALLVKFLGLSMGATMVLAPFLAVAGAIIFGWFCVRLSGVYLAMLTLAFAQISWSVIFQWDDVTGGDNGLLGIWPDAWAADQTSFYYVTLAIVGISVYAIRRIVFSPFGYTLRGCRDSLLRADAIGIDRLRIQWFGFVLAGSFAGVGGVLFAYLKGSVFPDYISIPLSVDGLVMVLLGGIQTVAGPIVGAGVFKALSTFIISHTEFWKIILGSFIIVLVVAFPQGIVGFFLEHFSKKKDSIEEGKS
jgi:branched-chain amino acid transport system permease protein